MNNTEKEELRETVLEVLVTRHPTALSTQKVFHRAAQTIDFMITEDSVLAALEVLKGLGMVELVQAPFGSTSNWTASAQGVIAWERSSNPRRPGRD